LHTLIIGKLKGKENFEDLGVNERIILILLFKQGDNDVT
jgi:hypothetical protein